MSHLVSINAVLSVRKSQGFWRNWEQRSDILYCIAGTLCRPLEVCLYADFPTYLQLPWFLQIHLKPPQGAQLPEFCLNSLSGCLWSRDTQDSKLGHWKGYPCLFPVLQGSPFLLGVHCLENHFIYFVQCSFLVQAGR